MRTAKALALAISVLVFARLPKADLGANGVHLGDLEVLSGPVEPYNLSVWMSPRITAVPMQMTIYISDMATDGPVTDATVHVLAQGPGRNPPQSVGSTVVSGLLTNASWYGVNIPIERAGRWVFTLTVLSSLGEGRAEFPVMIEGSVERDRGTSWGVVGALVAVLVIVAWTALSWRVWKGRRSARTR
jgi:hypothetical protein